MEAHQSPGFSLVKFCICSSVNCPALTIKTKLAIHVADQAYTWDRDNENLPHSQGAKILIITFSKEVLVIKNSQP